MISAPFRICVLGALLSACGTHSSPFDQGPGPVDRQELHNAIEVALRHVMRSDSWGAVDYYCLGVPPMTAAGPSNPPAELLNRMSAVRPPVVRASSCEITPQQVTHRATRTPAQLFLVDAADWQGGDEVLVVIRAFVNRTNSRSQRCSVLRSSEAAWSLGRCTARVGA